MEYDGYLHQMSADLNYTMLEYQNGTFSTYETFEAINDRYNLDYEDSDMDLWELTWNQNGQQTAGVYQDYYYDGDWFGFLQSLWLQSNRDYEFSQQINFHHRFSFELEWGEKNCLPQLLALSQSRFSFPDFTQDISIISLFDTLNLSGNLIECYQVSENFYYAIMEENGVETGYLICAVKENGQVIYKIVHESTEILPEDTLTTEGNHYTFDSNIQVEFEEIKDFVTEEDYVNYFTTALQNITGITLNDQGKSELALSMQDSIVNFATFVKNLASDTGEIRQEEVAPLVEKSNSLYQDFVTLLREEQAELNKDL